MQEENTVTPDSTSADVSLTISKTIVTELTSSNKALDYLTYALIILTVIGLTFVVYRIVTSGMDLSEWLVKNSDDIISHIMMGSSVATFLVLFIGASERGVNMVSAAARYVVLLAMELFLYFIVVRFVTLYFKNKIEENKHKPFYIGGAGIVFMFALMSTIITQYAYIESTGSFYLGYDGGLFPTIYEDNCCARLEFSVYVLIYCTPFFMFMSIVMTYVMLIEKNEEPLAPSGSSSLNSSSSSSSSLNSSSSNSGSSGGGGGVSNNRPSLTRNPSNSRSFSNITSGN